MSHPEDDQWERTRWHRVRNLPMNPEFQLSSNPEDECSSPNSGSLPDQTVEAVSHRLDNDDSKEKCSSPNTSSMPDLTVEAVPRRLDDDDSEEKCSSPDSGSLPDLTVEAVPRRLDNDDSKEKCSPPNTSSLPDLTVEAVPRRLDDDDSEEECSSPDSGSLPDLTVEAVPHRLDDDDSPEFYEGFERRMTQYYRQLFLEFLLSSNPEDECSSPNSGSLPDQTVEAVSHRLDNDDSKEKCSSPNTSSMPDLTVEAVPRRLDDDDSEEKCSSPDSGSLPDLTVEAVPRRLDNDDSKEKCSPPNTSSLPDLTVEAVPRCLDDDDSEEECSSPDSGSLPDLTVEAVSHRLDNDDSKEKCSSPNTSSLPDLTVEAVPRRLDDDDSEEECSSPDSSSLPDLTVEAVPRRLDDDDSPEFYEGLERRMTQYYRQLFLGAKDLQDSVSTDSNVINAFHEVSETEFSEDNITLDGEISEQVNTEPSDDHSSNTVTEVIDTQARDEVNSDGIVNPYLGIYRSVETAQVRPAPPASPQVPLSCSVQVHSFHHWIQIIQGAKKLIVEREADNLLRNKFKVESSIWKGVESYAGFITVDKKYDSNLFFWYFPTRDANESTPWIIWLHGGPGVSALVGMFEINGPFIIQRDEVHLRNSSWTSGYSVLYIDNPVGAGYSYTRDDRGYTSSEDEVGRDLLEFLQQFLVIFTELRQRPLFVAGESYAGKYVPNLALALHRHRRESSYSVNLRGIMIGNGLIDPRSMMHYTELCLVLGLLDEEQGKVLRQLETEAVELLDAGRMVDAANKFNETIEYIKMHSAVSFLNFNADGPASYSFLDFLTRPDVKKSIHVENAAFNVNNQLVYEKMLPDFMNTTKAFVEELLEYYGVLCYSGQLDVILPYWGSKHTYESLRWSRRREYDEAPRTHMKLYATGPVVGYKKSGGRFTDALIRGAGHMAPKDKPDVVRGLIDEFIVENTLPSPVKSRS